MGGKSWYIAVYIKSIEVIKMKVKDLIKALQGLEEFDVELAFHDSKLEKQYAGKMAWNYQLRFLNVIGIADIGFSEKTVLLDGCERWQDK
jgi:hypothetical protein